MTRWLVSCAALLSVPALAHGYYPPTERALGPWYGTGAPGFGAPECGMAQTMEQEVLCQLDRLEQLDLPISAFLFDGNGWSLGNSILQPGCAGPQCCTWALGDTVLQRLAARDVRAMLHFWGGCHTIEHFQHVHARIGDRLFGFYFDDGSTDADGKRAIDWLQGVMPGDSEVVLKAFAGVGGATDQGLRENGNICYVNDLGTDWEGLREGIRRMFAKSALVAMPYNEFTSYDPGRRPSEEEYVRRLHFGALQPVMAQTPWMNADPWHPDYSPALIERYRYYSWLHLQLVPYLYSYAWRMHETGEPVIREPDAARFTTKLGAELFVAYVTDSVSTVRVTLPPGRWIDFWDESRVLEGTSDVAAPLGREPIFIREGAIIPMRVSRSYTGHGTAESAGKLTVLVYPAGESRFAYREAASARWVELRASASGGALALTAEPSPSSPVLYRIRWSEKPEAVVEIDGGVRIGGPGPKLTELSSEAEVNGADAGSWFFDSAAKRLIVRAGPAVPEPAVEAPPPPPRCGCASTPGLALLLGFVVVISKSATRSRKVRGFVASDSK